MVVFVLGQAAKEAGIATYVTTKPYAKAVDFAQSFMQRAIQSPAEESKAFMTAGAVGSETKIDALKEATTNVTDIVAPRLKAATLRNPLPTYNASLLSIATAVPENSLYVFVDVFADFTYL